MTPVEDMDKWQNKTLPVTNSAELQNLERNSQYAITVAALTKDVSSTSNPASHI